MKILSCDLETTGLDPMGDCWITGSFAVLDFETLEVERELDLQSRPTNWSQEAFNVHKIREEIAMNFPERKESLKRLVEFVPKEDFVFLCHAKPDNFNKATKTASYYHFDFAFLKMDFVYNWDMFIFYQLFSDDRVISTYTIGKQLVNDGKLGLSSLKLNLICDHFGIKFSHHNARSDRIAMEQVLRRFRELERSNSSLI